MFINYLADLSGSAGILCVNLCLRILAPHLHHSLPRCELKFVGMQSLSSENSQKFTERNISAPPLIVLLYITVFKRSFGN